MRAFLQLLAMGFLLVYLFRYQSWWLVCLVLLAMTLAATQIAVGRTKHAVRGLWLDVFLSIFVSSMVIAFIVVDGIIHANPWYNAQDLIPISGMILGNTLSSAATTLAIVMICFLTYRKRFSSDGFYLSPALRDDGVK